MRRSELDTPAGRLPALSLTLERFDYARVGDQVAVVQVLAALAPSAGPPPAAELVIYTGAEAPLVVPVRACRCELRLLPGGSRELLWRGLFTAPLSTVERGGVLFELRSRTGAETLTLPVPARRHPGPAVLQLVPSASLTRAAQRPLRQAAAMATAVAVTASSTPGLALAASGGSANGPASRPAAVSHHVSRRPAGRAGASRPGKHPRGLTRRRADPVAVAEPVCPPGESSGISGAAPATAASPSSTCTLARRHPARAHHPHGQEGLGQRRSAPAPSPAPRPGPGGAPSRAPAPASGPGSVAGPSGGVAPGGGTSATPPPATQSGTTQPGATRPPSAQPPSTHPGTRAKPPAPSRSHTEPTSRAKAPVSPRRTIPGGASLGGLSERPPRKLDGSPTATGGAPTLSATPPGYLGPKSWTGTVTEDPALIGALGNLSNLLANGDNPPAFLIPVYMEAGKRYHVPWEVLAAINAVESDYGRNLNTSSAGAIGWMQFEPSTWRQYGMAVDGHSVPNPYDPRDAIFSAARYLAAAGAATDIWGAVYAYNHASWYVNMVLTRARAIVANVQPERQTVRRGMVSVFFSTDQRRHPTIRFRGGLLSHYVRLVASANMVSAANFPYVWGGGHEQPARFAPFDCSGSVSYVMQQAGYKVPTSVSGNIGRWGFPSGPGRVTIFYNPTHTFMRIGSRYFGTSGFARPGGGAGWFSANRLPASYLAQFSEVHVPALGANSFARHRRVRLNNGHHRLFQLSSTLPGGLSQLTPFPPFAHTFKLSV